MTKIPISADDYNAITTALGAICYAVTRRLPDDQRKPFLIDLVTTAHARNTAGDLRAETLLLDLARAVAMAIDHPAQNGGTTPNG